MVALREWLANHPAITVLDAAATVASTTSETATYLLEQVKKVERIELTDKYNAQISDLTASLSSIERRTATRLAARVERSRIRPAYAFSHPTNGAVHPGETVTNYLWRRHP
jgi:hypothetical protein